MTLELSRVAAQVRAMGEELAAREGKHADLVQLARHWLAHYAGQGEQLRDLAFTARAAIPTAEPLDAIYPLPTVPERFTVITADGSQVQPDRHGAALYYLINVGSLVYRHGSGQAPQAHSQPTLGYTEADLYEGRLLVGGNLLDVRRDLAELTRLADLCAAEPSGPMVAIADGTLILWVLEDLPAEGRQKRISDYLAQLDRIRRTGAGVAAFVSRPRYGDVARLLHLANVGGDAKRANQEPNPLEYLPDRAIFEMLPPGARSALFISPSPINHDYYHPDHTVHFCYVNLAAEGHEPVIARIEFPAWVATSPGVRTLIHGAIVAQARITGDYPYALARADELAYISTQEREAFEAMITTALLRAGVRSALSPKAYYKTLTRQGRRKHRV